MRLATPLRSVVQRLFCLYTYIGFIWYQLQPPTPVIISHFRINIRVNEHLKQLCTLSEFHSLAYIPPVLRFSSGGVVAYETLCDSMKQVKELKSVEVQLKKTPQDIWTYGRLCLQH